MCRRRDAYVGTTGQEPSNSINGMIRYNTTLTDVEAYIGGYWTTLTTGSGGTSTLYLGTSAVVPNLAASSSDTQTGLYTSASGHVDITASGSQTVDISSTGLNVVSTTGGVQLGGVNALSFPPDFTSNGSIAIGQGALTSQTAGASRQDNIAIGYQALGSTSLTTAAIQNTAVGFWALKNNSSGYGNTAIGFQTLLKNLTGVDNMAFGSSTLQSLISGSYNTALGNHALFNTTDSYSTAVGSYALGYATVGGGDTAVGNDALEYHTTGGNNVAVGQTALQGIGTSTPMTGSFNTGVGSNALTNIQGSASNNSAVGYQAGAALTSGSTNTLVGYNVASTTLTTEASNILIGVGSGSVAGGADIPTAGTSNYLDIGNTIFATGMTGTISSPAGSVGIGTTAPQATLDVKGYVKLALNSSQPAACSTGNDGSLALTHTHNTCVCVGSSAAWVSTVTGANCAW